MTFLEKLEKDGEYPYRALEIMNGLVWSCPSDYGYEPPKRCDDWVDCRECWNREASDGK